jgi:hypothetical protein
MGGWIHEGMCWGAAAIEKNGSTTSKRKTAMIRLPPRTFEEKRITKNPVTPFYKALSSFAEQNI